MDIVRVNNTIKLDRRSNKADFTFSWTARDAEGELIDLTDATIACALSDYDGVVLQARSDDGDGVITINGAVISFAFPQTSVSDFDGTYSIGCTSLLDTSTTQLFIGTVAFYDGVALV